MPSPAFGLRIWCPAVARIDLTFARPRRRPLRLDVCPKKKSICFSTINLKKTKGRKAKWKDMHTATCLFLFFWFSIFLRFLALDMGISRTVSPSARRKRRNESTTQRKMERYDSMLFFFLFFLFSIFLWFLALDMGISRSGSPSARRKRRNESSTQRKMERYDSMLFFVFVFLFSIFFMVFGTRYGYFKICLA